MGVHGGSNRSSIKGVTPRTRESKLGRPHGLRHDEGPPAPAIGLLDGPRWVLLGITRVEEWGHPEQGSPRVNGVRKG